MIEKGSRFFGRIVKGVTEGVVRPLHAYLTDPDGRKAYRNISEKYSQRTKKLRTDWEPLLNPEEALVQDVEATRGDWEQGIRKFYELFNGRSPLSLTADECVSRGLMIPEVLHTQPDRTWGEAMSDEERYTYLMDNRSVMLDNEKRMKQGDYWAALVYPYSKSIYSLSVAYLDSIGCLPEKFKEVE